MTKLKIFLVLIVSVGISAFPADETLESADTNRAANNRGRAWSAWSSASHSGRGRFNGKTGNVDNLHSNGTVSQEPSQGNAAEAQQPTQAPSAAVADKEPVTVMLPGTTGTAENGGTTVQPPTTVAPQAPTCGNLQQLPPPVPLVPIGPNVSGGYPPLENLVQQVAGNRGKNETPIVVVMVPIRDTPLGAPVGAGDLRSLHEMAPRSEEQMEQGGLMF